MTMSMPYDMDNGNKCLHFFLSSLYLMYYILCVLHQGIVITINNHGICITKDVLLINLNTVVDTF